MYIKNLLLVVLESFEFKTRKGIIYTEFKIFQKNYSSKENINILYYKRINSKIKIDIPFSKVFITIKALINDIIIYYKET